MSADGVEQTVSQKTFCGSYFGSGTESSQLPSRLLITCGWSIMIQKHQKRWRNVNILQRWLGLNISHHNNNVKLNPQIRCAQLFRLSCNCPVEDRRGYPKSPWRGSCLGLDPFLPSGHHSYNIQPALPLNLYIHPSPLPQQITWYGTREKGGARNCFESFYMIKYNNKRLKELIVLFNITLRCM